MNPSPSALRALRRGTALAAAVCCFSPLAGAQSTVTIYGSMDAYVGSQSASGQSKRTVLNSNMNPNSLGFAGTEALGGGLSAGFVLEGQPALDTGAMGQGGKFFGRQANVYLNGDFGRVTLGRVHLPGRSFGIKYSATGWLTTDPLGNLLIAAGNSLAPVMNIDSAGSRVSNALMYSMPRVGGFTATLVQSAGEGGSFAAGSAKLTQLGASYSAGAFSTDFVYSKIPELAGSQVAQTDYSVGAQVTVSGVRLMAAYFSHEGSSIATPGSTTAIAGSKGTDRSYHVGASLPMGPHTVGVSYGALKVADVHRGRRAANMSAPFSTIVDDTTGWSVAYSYALSKRTQLFAAYGTLDNDALGQASIAPDLRPTAGGSSSLLASGVRHSF
ncbi:MAG: porin [Rubrivivax sp.]|nr:porin [Rubrivivax sp.]